MRVYIRHGDKEFRNNETSCDPPLTIEGRDKVSSLALELYSTFGFPSLIITSPFLRARETASILRFQVLRLARKREEDLPLLVDRKIGEYLGNQKKPLLEKETSSFQPFIENNISSFIIRVREHNDTFIALEKENFTFWFISHGLVIKKLARFNGFFLPGYPDFLAGLVISQEKTETFGSWGNQNN